MLWTELWGLAQSSGLVTNPTSPPARPLGHPANCRAHDSMPETLMPEGNKSWVSGVGVGLNNT
jgi:hypothetical protein